MPTSPHLQKSPAFRNCLKSPLKSPLSSSAEYLNRSLLSSALDSGSLSSES